MNQKSDKRTEVPSEEELQPMIVEACNEHLAMTEVEPDIAAIVTKAKLFIEMTLRNSDTANVREQVRRAVDSWVLDQLREGGYERYHMYMLEQGYSDEEILPPQGMDGFKLKRVSGFTRADATWMEIEKRALLVGTEVYKYYRRSKKRGDMQQLGPFVIKKITPNMGVVLEDEDGKTEEWGSPFTLRRVEDVDRGNV